MNALRLGFLVCLFLALGSLTGCSTISVNTDYSEGTDFSTYKTFDFPPEQGTVQEQSVGQISPFIFDRAQKKARTVLKQQGYQEDINNPDFHVVFQAGSQQKTDVSSYGYGYWGVGGNVAVSQYDEGTFIIDLVDASANKLFWRGTAQGILSGSGGQNTSQLDAAVQKILAKFPPK